MFLLCLSLPAIVLFSLTPLWGGRGQPHWTMPGWFFVFPLMGVWINELAVSTQGLLRGGFLSSGFLPRSQVSRLSKSRPDGRWRS